MRLRHGMLVATTILLLSLGSPMLHAEDAAEPTEVTMEASPEPVVLEATPLGEQVDSTEEVDPADTVDLPDSAVEQSGEQPVEKTAIMMAASNTQAVDTATLPNSRTPLMGKVILFGLVGGLSIWLTSYRLYVSKRSKP